MQELATVSEGTLARSGIESAQFSGVLAVVTHKLSAERLFETFQKLKKIRSSDSLSPSVDSYTSYLDREAFYRGPSWPGRQA